MRLCCCHEGLGFGRLALHGFRSRHVLLAAKRASPPFQAGYDVLGSYISPVNDAYWKQALAPGRHRVRMCQLATADSGRLAGWEG